MSSEDEWKSAVENASKMVQKTEAMRPYFKWLRTDFEEERTKRRNEKRKAFLGGFCDGMQWAFIISGFIFNALMWLADDPVHCAIYGVASVLLALSLLLSEWIRTRK